MFNLLGWQYKLGAALVVAALCGYSGWTLKGWKEDSLKLANKEAVEAFVKEYRANEAGKASILEEKLSSLKANERIIEREKLKIIDRPVYLNECLDADGVRLLEQARTGKPNTSKPVD